MGSLVSLAIYALIAAAAFGAVYAAWTGFKGWVAAPYVAEQIAADQKVVNAANANQKSAELERDNAKSDTAQCTAILVKQNDAIASWKLAAERNLAASREAKKQAMKEATANAPVIADLQAKAAAAPKLMVCTDELAKAKEMMRQSLCAKRGITCPTPEAPVSPPVLVK